MPKVKIVTGYVPIPKHPRPASEYGKLGEQLAAIRTAPLKSYYWPLSRCWLHQWLSAQPFDVQPAVADSVAKNTLDYHVVQHQKFEWLLYDSILDQDSDVFVWIDYGIMHVPGVTIKVITDFLEKIRDNDLAIPGCWQVPPNPINDDWPCWRFCGGVFVVPRAQVALLDLTVKSTLKKHITKTKKLSWEVNTLARIERADLLPIRWYQADHNETIFSGYDHAQG